MFDTANDVIARPEAEAISRRGISLRGLLAMTAVLFFSLAGCSEIKTPTVAEVMTHPLGTAAPFTRGTLKAKVLQDWGKPDVVIPHGTDELGNMREEWIYHGRMQSLPIDYEYVSRTKHLFFEGNNLTRWSTEEPVSPEKK